jgi:hypothetical protein
MPRELYCPQSRLSSSDICDCPQLRLPHVFILQSDRASIPALHPLAARGLGGAPAAVGLAVAPTSSILGRCRSPPPPTTPTLTQSAAATIGDNLPTSNVAGPHRRIALPAPSPALPPPSPFSPSLNSSQRLRLELELCQHEEEGRHSVGRADTGRAPPVRFTVYKTTNNTWAFGLGNNMGMKKGSWAFGLGNKMGMKKGSSCNAFPLCVTRAFGAC